MIQKIPKKYHRVEFHGTRWWVTVLDGNGVEWLSYFPTTGTTVFHGDMTPKIAREIIAALHAAIDSSLIKDRAAERPPAKIITLKSRKEHCDGDN